MALGIGEHGSDTFYLWTQVESKDYQTCQPILQIPLYSGPIFLCHITVLDPGLFHTYPRVYKPVSLAYL